MARVNNRQHNFVSAGGVGLRLQANQTKRVPTVGKRPLPEPTSVKRVFAMLIMHVCRRIVLFDPALKVPVYMAALVCGSLLTEFLPFPKSYFSQKSNVLNRVFVKWCWSWTLIVTGLYIGLTSWIYCCGNVKRVSRHFYRLLVGTVFWLLWTKLFVLIEWSTGSCVNAKYITKLACNKHGHAWVGFDFSGHAFLLIYCSLLITEEAMSIKGWERISELIRNEEFDDESPLKSLSGEEREHLQKNYNRFTPYIRCAFVALTLLSVLWDIMLVTTILYFHYMVQKVVAGMIGICTWFLTYHWWYNFSSSPGLPGQGLFKYMDVPVPVRGRIGSFANVHLFRECCI